MSILMERLSSHNDPDKFLVKVDDIQASMLPIYTRMEMLSTLFGNEPPWPYPIALDAAVPTKFDSLEDARNSVTHLANLSLRFIRSVQHCKYEPFSLPSSATGEQAALLHHLDLWTKRLSAYQVICEARKTPTHMYAANVLKIGHIVMTIWVNVAFTRFECAHDAYMHEFETAVSLAEQLPVIASTADQSMRYANTFTLDVEMIGPIHWVSIKCRDPVVRRRALEVQRGTRRREGLWDSQAYAALAERIIALEETGLEAGEMPPENARVHHAMIERSRDIAPMTHVITVQSMPDGIGGGLVTWQDHVSLDTIN